VGKYGFEKDFEVVHLGQLLAESLPFEKLKLDQKITATYHDPCFLGRHQGVYDTPREVLSAIEGLELVEMPRNRRNAFCCGSGGGVQEGFRDYSIETAEKRCEEISHVNADLVVTACPGCKNNLWGPSRAIGVQTFDLAEIVNKALGE
ncbi:MAG: (Fe-S)-binding protein, partial [Deltaproteobacteria bacterium]|nr:(Fe-S)-binding protein [Deltaproteobacteria bacterium]